MTTHKTACILCSRNCGIEVEVEGGHLTKIRGDEAHPISEGYLCQKAARLDAYQNNDDRVTHPLRRRADGTFERVGWDEAIAAIAAQLVAIREAHGGSAFAFYGGGGQGNHLGAAYGTPLLDAMKSPYLYNALAQEKTGDFWVNGKLFGRQNCHITEDVDNAHYVLFIGTNPWQAHGIRNARDAVRGVKKSGERKMAVIDPRRSETAELADVHLQLRPGTDAFLLTAMLAILARDGLVDRAFLRQRTTGFDELERHLRLIPIAEFIARAGVSMSDVEKVVRDFATAPSACVRVDLGLQQSLHSTLNSYLEKLLFLVTGHFGVRGGNTFHSLFLPILSHSDDARNVRTRATGIAAICKLYPPNVLPAEILSERPDRVRALFVDSANPAMSGADTQAYERAFSKLELLVVVDVAMTETARHAHWVLPAASQFEKWEATGFNLDFPVNGFHLRAPIFEPRGECLPEPEIYTRLLRAMGELPARFPVLEAVARLDRKAPSLGLMFGALLVNMAVRPKLRRYGAHLLYETLGRALPGGARVAAPLWVLAHGYARKHRDAVRRAGHRGGLLGLGESLFRSVLESRSGMVLSEHRYEDTFSFIRHPDKKIHLAVPEMLAAIDALAKEPEIKASDDYPLVLIAGERRSYNANTIYRDPAWRRQDVDGTMTIHPEDADRLGLADGDKAWCRSSRGAIEIVIKRSDRIRPGVVTLPHGYGMRYRGGAVNGPALNRLTDSEHRDPIAATPFHKYVRVRLEKCRAAVDGGDEIHRHG